jgi:hypothetical protein
VVGEFDATAALGDTCTTAAPAPNERARHDALQYFQAPAKGVVKQRTQGKPA